MTSLPSNFFALSDEELTPYVSKALELSWTYHGRILRCYYPGRNFPALSVTGSTCALSCAHCNKKYLKGMIPATSPRELRHLCRRLVKKGAKGILISGGCDEEGIVPLSPFLDTIAQVKQETGLVISVHTGLVGSTDAKALAEAQIDVACVDVIGADRTIQEILGLEKTTQDYQNTLEALFAETFLTVPHVCLGLHYGTALGIPKALELSLSFAPSLVVLLMLLPTPGTPLQHVTPPSTELLRKAILWARLTQPRTALSLGCMRPRSEQIDRMAVETGINRIEIPRKAALTRAVELGYTVKKIEACCSLPTQFED